MGGGGGGKVKRSRRCILQEAISTQCRRCSLQEAISAQCRRCSLQEAISTQCRRCSLQEAISTQCRRCSFINTLGLVIMQSANAITCLRVYYGAHKLLLFKCGSTAQAISQLTDVLTALLLILLIAHLKYLD